MGKLIAGSFLMAAGLILLIYTLFFMDVTVAVNYPSGVVEGMPSSVVNLDLISQRQIYAFASIAMVAVGLIFFFISNPKRKRSLNDMNDTKKCPQCAELVKKEAKICRFCNYTFTEGEIQHY